MSEEKTNSITICISNELERLHNNLSSIVNFAITDYRNATKKGNNPNTLQIRVAEKIIDRIIILENFLMEME